jgi:small subunit ribosomal protein S8
MTADPIGDMLTRIRNAGMALHPTVSMPYSKMKGSIAEILKREGYVADTKVEGDKLKTLTITLKYQARKPVIVGLKLTSTPGLRRYVNSKEIPQVLGGMGVSILSTSRGLMTGTQARRENVGGELVCYIW